MVCKALVLAFLLTVTGGASATKENDNDIHGQLVDLQQRHVGWLLDHPDVTGVDVNHKTVGGEQTDQLSLVIWVKKKLPEEEVSEKRRLPRDIEGFQTDVVEGEIKPLALTVEDVDEPTQSCSPQPSPCMNFTETVTQTLTPTESMPTLTPTPTLTPPNEPCPCRNPLTQLKGGHCLIIKNTIPVGTLGYFTITRRGRNIGILSNFHVTGGRGNRLTSTPTHLRDFVATVAVAHCNKSIDASHSNLCRRRPRTFQLVDGTVVPGTRVAQCYDRVRFCGCSSGCTGAGRIFSTNFCGSYRCTPSSPLIIVCNQILFTPIALDGDSGSLLINADTNEATGLVFSGVVRRIAGRKRDLYGVANPIQTVLNQLGVDLAV